MVEEAGPYGCILMWAGEGEEPTGSALEVDDHDVDHAANETYLMEEGAVAMVTVLLMSQVEAVALLVLDQVPAASMAVMAENDC